MSVPEFSRPIRTRPLPGGKVRLEADEAERAALAARFGISGIEALVAEVALDETDSAIRGEGRLRASIVQACAVSGEDFAARIDEPLAFRFVADGGTPAAPDMEIELEADDLDEIEYSGDSFDLGEAVAQSLGLAIDPYAEGPDADAARKAAGITGDDAPSGPLAEALAALKKG